MQLTKKENDKLFDTYYNLSSSGGLASIKKLADVTKISSKKVRHFLHTQRLYTLFKPRIKKFKRQKIILYGSNYTHGMDLLDVSRFAKHNNNIRFLLTVIDMFSRKAFVKPLKNKSGLETAKAIKELYTTDGNIPPRFIWVDRGREFINRDVDEVLETLKIRRYHSFSKHKVSPVERFNRTLSSKIYKLIYMNNDHDYVSQLAKIVQTYNNTKTRSHGMKPNKVTALNREIVWHNLYSKKKNLPLKPKYQIGDYVRNVRSVNQYSKGFLPPYSEEIFKIHSIKYTNPVTYKLVDLEKDLVNGYFYDFELVKVQNFDEATAEYLVEKVIKRRIVNGRKEVFIHYFDLPDHFDAWIPADQLRDL